MFDITGYTEVLTIDEAVNCISNDINAKLICGGTDVLIKIRARDKSVLNKKLVGISRIPELKNITLDKDKSISIGAAATFTEIENNPIIKKYFPTLSEAASTVGGPQIRNIGTIGGNICNAATSADCATPLFAANATLIIKNPLEYREVPISDFYLGPCKANIKQNELLISIKIKHEDYDSFKGHYIKFAQREAMDIAMLSCTTLLKEKAGIIEDLRIAFGVASPIPVRAHTAEKFAMGKHITIEILDSIGEECLKDTKPRNSWRASEDFRKNLITVLPGRCIQKILKENKEGN